MRGLPASQPARAPRNQAVDPVSSHYRSSTPANVRIRARLDCLHLCAPLTYAGSRAWQRARVAAYCTHTLLLLLPRGCLQVLAAIWATIAGTRLTIGPLQAAPPPSPPPAASHTAATRRALHLLQSLFISLSNPCCNRVQVHPRPPQVAAAGTAVAAAPATAGVPPEPPSPPSSPSSTPSHDSIERRSSRLRRHCCRLFRLRLGRSRRHRQCSPPLPSPPDSRCCCCCRCYRHSYHHRSCHRHR